MDTAKPTVDHLIDRQTAELRHDFPGVLDCRARMDTSGEGLTQRFSLELDVRLSQGQCLVAGESHHDALAAIYAAFNEARTRLGMPDLDASRTHAKSAK
jgi:ribosome-associated translation inhibitor RaiA